MKKGKVMAVTVLICAGLYYLKKKYRKLKQEISRLNSKIFRINEYLNIYASVINNRRESSVIVKKLQEMDVKKVAVYGKGTLGDLVSAELRDTPIEIVAYIDKNASERTYQGKATISIGVSADLYTEGRDEKIKSLKEMIE